MIAFNILNIGRLKLGPAGVGAAKNVFAICIKYAKQRKAFGSAIASLARFNISWLKWRSVFLWRSR